MATADIRPWPLADFPPHRACEGGTPMDLREGSQPGRGELSHTLRVVDRLGEQQWRGKASYWWYEWRCHSHQYAQYLYSTEAARLVIGDCDRSA